MSTASRGSIEHVGDGVYLHRLPGGDFEIAVNDHRNSVVFLEAPVAAALVKSIGGTPAPAGMPRGDSRPDACARGEAIWNLYKANGRAGRGPLCRQLAEMIADLLVFGLSEHNVAADKAIAAGEDPDDLMVVVIDDTVEAAIERAELLMGQD